MKTSLEAELSSPKWLPASFVIRFVPAGLVINRDASLGELLHLHSYQFFLNPPPSRVCIGGRSTRHLVGQAAMWDDLRFRTVSCGRPRLCPLQKTAETSGCIQAVSGLDEWGPNQTELD